MGNNSNGKVVFYRRAHLWFALALLVIVVGFFRSFFSKATAIDASHHFHGITATLWMLLLIVQPYLYSKGKMRLHRQLGKVSFVLMPLIIAGGIMMIHIMINTKDQYPPLTVYQLSFLDVFYILQFITFFALAMVHRRDVQYHARYMAGTILLLLPPGLARLFFLFPQVDSFTKSLNLSYVVVELVVLALLLDDKRSGKIRMPYVLALGCFILQHIGLHFIYDWKPWQDLMDAFAKL